LARVRIGKLTPHEREVFHLVIRGQTNKQMANTLGGTARSIEAHRRRVMEKMQIQSLAELVSLLPSGSAFWAVRRVMDRQPSRVR
jgi:FixJ family two-component response regulator